MEHLFLFLSFDLLQIELELLALEDVAVRTTNLSRT